LAETNGILMERKEDGLWSIPKRGDIATTEARGFPINGPLRGRTPQEGPRGEEIFFIPKNTAKEVHPTRGTWGKYFYLGEEVSDASLPSRLTMGERERNLVQAPKERKEE